MSRDPRLTLKEHPTLSDMQTYVTMLEKERGFDGDLVLQKTLHLGEEVGELFKAIRKAEHMRVDARSDTKHISEELADILIFLLSIANRYGIDVEQAFREKEKINRERTWV